MLPVRGVAVCLTFVLVLQPALKELLLIIKAMQGTPSTVLGFGDSEIDAQLLLRAVLMKFKPLPLTSLSYVTLKAPFRTL